MKLRPVSEAGLRCEMEERVSQGKNESRFGHKGKEGRRWEEVVSGIGQCTVVRM